MANPTIIDSTQTNPGGTGSTITVTLPTHAVGDIIYISIGNTGNTLWTGNPTGWNRIQQVQVGTSTTGLLGTWFWRKVVSGDSLPLASPAFTLGATVSRIATARSIRGGDLEGPFSLPEYTARGYNTGTANPVRPATVTAPAPEILVLHDYFQRAATNAPDPSGYTQDEEIIISGTLVGNAARKAVADQQTSIANQDASPTSGVRWVAGIACIPSPDYAYYRIGSQALTASGTSATPTLPTGTSASDNRGNKDLVIATIEVAGTPAISPQVGADWTEITGWANTTSGNGTTVKKYWALYDGSLNLQFNRSTTGEIFVYLSTYRNTRQSAPIGSVAVQQNASSTTSAFPSLVRTLTKATVQITCITDAVPTFTSPSTWTERNDSNGVTCSDQPFNATGTVSSASFTLSSAGPTLAGIMEIASVASVAEFSRSAIVDGSASVQSSASFLSILSRSAVVNASAAVITAGNHIVSRSAVLGVSADISSAGVASTPSTTFERSSLISCSSSIATSAISFSVLSGVSAVDGVASVSVSATFFSVFMRSLVIDTSAAVTVSGLFFTELSTSVVLNAGVSIDSSGVSLTEFNRSLAFDANLTVESSGVFFSTLERLVTLNTSSAIETSATLFSVFQSTALIDGIGNLVSSGQIQSGVTEFERSVLLNGSASISAAGVFFSIAVGSASHNSQVAISISGMKELLRVVSFEAIAGIGAIGATTSEVVFHPHGTGRVNRENRFLFIGEENRRI